MENLEILEKYLDFVQYFRSIISDWNHLLKDGIFSDTCSFASDFWENQKENDFYKRQNTIEGLLEKYPKKENSYYYEKIIEMNFVMKKLIIYFLQSNGYDVDGIENSWDVLLHKTCDIIQEVYPSIDISSLRIGLGYQYDRGLRNTIEHHRHADTIGFDKVLFSEFQMTAWDFHSIVVRSFSMGTMICLTQSEAHPKIQDTIKTVYVYMLNNSKDGTILWESSRRHLPFLYPCRVMLFSNMSVRELIESIQTENIKDPDHIIKVERQKPKLNTINV